MVKSSLLIQGGFFIFINIDATFYAFISLISRTGSKTKEVGI
jgi:hypothetical protein